MQVGSSADEPGCSHWADENPPEPEGPITEQVLCFVHASPPKKKTKTNKQTTKQTKE